jgi:chorismate synthase
MGDGMESTYRFGSANNDGLALVGSSNHDGGIQGGISNGKQIAGKISFKPVSTIAKTQKTLNTNGEEIEFAAKGRHDPCVLPRAVVVVEAMAALVLADNYLLSLSDQWKPKTTS